MSRLRGRSRRHGLRSREDRRISLPGRVADAVEQRSLPDLPECLICRVDWHYRNFAGVGWWPLLEEMHQRLLIVRPGYRLDQVKEKFELLRVYPNDERYRDTPELEARLDEGDHRVRRALRQGLREVRPARLAPQPP